jgi:VanZ family protein
VKIIKHLSEHKLLALAITFTIGITIASLASLSNMPRVEVPGKDKTVHFLFYFVLTLLWNFALQKKYKNWALKYIIVFVVIIYGIVIEVLQGVLTKNREADIYDVIANSAGTLVALIVVFLAKNKTFKKKLKNILLLTILAPQN